MDDERYSTHLAGPTVYTAALRHFATGITHLIYSLRTPANDFIPVERLLRWRAGKRTRRAPAREAMFK